MSKSRIFFILSLSFLAGIFGASFYYPKAANETWLFFVLVAALIIFAVFYENKKIFLPFFVMLFFLSGVWLTTAKLTKIKNIPAETENFSGTVRIIQAPDINDTRQNLVVAPENNASRKILLGVSAYQKFSYGEKLKLDCELAPPKNLAPDFDYKMYLAMKGIYYQCQKPKIEKLPGFFGNKIYSGLLETKNSFEDNINRFIPAPEAGLLIGLILGGSHQLGKDIQAEFSRTGLSHVTAVSGYNVTIVAEYLMILGIAIGLWRRQAFWFAAIGIILFAIVTGLSASAVRASVMGILLIWAMKNGRLANSGNAILFSADVMLLANPLLLRFDVGFQLSFLATVGIIYFYPFFNDRLVKKHKAFGLSEILFLSLSAQVFVLPVILFNFSQLSLISPLANLLILPFIPLTMLLGFLAALVGFVSNPIATIFSWFAYLPLKYEMLAIDFFSRLKYASVPVKITWWEVMLWYIILVGFLIMRPDIKRKTINDQNFLLKFLFQRNEK